MNYRMLIVFLLVCLLTSCGRADYQINEELPEGMNTALQLKNFSDSQIRILGDKFQVGKIFMLLNKDMVGEVKLTYSNRGSEDDPTVAQIIINTKENKIKDMRVLGNDSKLDPGELDISSWTVDSNEAINNALNAANNIEDLKYDTIICQTYNYYLGKDEVWSVQFIDSSNNNEYWAIVDPETGEIIKNGNRY